MERKSILKNYIFNTGYQVFLLIVPFITMPYVSRVFGAERIGEYSFAESVAAIFVNLAPIGTAVYGRREISYHQDEREERTKIFWNIFFLRIITGSLASIIYIVYSFIVDFNIMSFVLTLNIISTIFDVSWFYQGVEDFKLIAIRNLVIKLIMMVCVFLFVRSVNDLMLYTFIICASTLLGNLSVFTRLKKYIDLISIYNIHPFNNIKTVFSLFLPTIALTLASILDKPMIGWLSNDYAQSGYYDQSQKIASVLMMLITSMATVMVARVGYHFQHNELDKIMEYMYRNYRFVTLLAIPICLGLISVAHLLIPLYLGDGYEGAIPVISILSLNIILVGISNVTGIQFLIPTKRQNLFTKSIMFGAIFNLIFDTLLIPIYGACGAVIATVIAEVIVNIVQLVGIRKEISIVKIIWQARKYIISGFIMLIVLQGINLICMTDLIKLVIMVFWGVIIYIMGLIIMKDDFFINCIILVKNKICIGKNLKISLKNKKP